MTRKICSWWQGAGAASVLLLAALQGCGGETGGNAGGQSHFLTYCDAPCGDGLTCISGLCTRSCVVSQSNCRDLNEAAVCTDQSIEPGAVAVCDLPCGSDADCGDLGQSFVCDAGFCRTDDDVSTSSSGGGTSTSTSSSSSGGGSSATTSTSTTGSAGNSCQVLFQEFPDGASDIPNPIGCGTCSCDNGNFLCSEEGCENGIKVFECPPDIQGDSIDSNAILLDLNSLTLLVGHSGGCAEHDYGLCYDAGFLESYPVQGGLRLIHDSHGDACEAYLSLELTFDLSPYAEYYNQSYGTDGGIIITNYGTYSFGELSCEERALAAGRQAEDAAAATLAPRPTGAVCVTNADCQWSSLNTTCAVGCGEITSALYADQFSNAMALIETNTCGNFETDGCPIPSIPPCAPPPDLACVDGTCVVAE